ncbi:MAG: sulfotransferase family 2 domain-containing protein [Bacteroidota bacterium]|nr:sulfotransferase family 2 domain-containing protein [Bacteroidota bacterium]
MVFNHEVLFIHLGKTGGISVMHYMLKSLKPPVLFVENTEYFHTNIDDGRINIAGNRHANLNEARTMLRKYGMELSDFKLIFVIVRDPIQMELSHYKHLRKERVIKRLQKFHHRNRGRIEAAQLSFDEFAKSPLTHFTYELETFFTLDGKTPDNMQIIRFEEMIERIPKLLKPYQQKQIPFPHRNKSTEEIDIGNLSLNALQNIRKKYGWIYEHGLYKSPV